MATNSRPLAINRINRLIFMSTTTTTTSFFGLFNDGFQSYDDDGHTGYGSTKEESQAALEHAQEVDAKASSNTLLFGWEDTPKD